ncbi:four helix bundle protein [Patescibacteria group bacterium]|nr:four helix bundle protein [Patescibacteria group bacterium]
MQNLEQLQNNAPIIKKTNELYREFYQYLKLFPKQDQYMLGKRCEEYILNFIELVLLCVGLEKNKKLEVLKQADSKFDVLKFLLMATQELKMLDNKKYLSLEKRMQEIGRMLGGWIRSLQEKRPDIHRDAFAI